MSDQVLFALLLLLLLYGNAHCNTAMFDPCKSQNDTTPEERRSFLDNWPMHLNGSTLDRSFKCYATCILFDSQIMDGAGKLHMEKYLETEALQESWPSSLAKCSTEFADSVDSCEYGFGIANCLLSLREAPE